MQRFKIDEIFGIVTRTVRELATGTDLVFAPLGSVGLRGALGEWELFEASSVEVAATRAGNR